MAGPRLFPSDDLEVTLWNDYNAAGPGLVTSRPVVPLCGPEDAPGYLAVRGDDAGHPLAAGGAGRGVGAAGEPPVEVGRPGQSDLSANQYRLVTSFEASTTSPVALFTSPLVVVTLFRLCDAESSMIGVPRPDAKTGLSIDAVFS
jgi:hypothetical protein